MRSALLLPLVLLGAHALAAPDTPRGPGMGAPPPNPGRPGGGPAVVPPVPQGTLLAANGYAMVALAGEPAVEIGTTEVPNGLFDTITGRNDADQRVAAAPATKVSWDGAVQFCNQLSEREGLRPAYRIRPRVALGGALAPQVEWDRSADGYRLPTEAEWARAAEVKAVKALAGGVWEWMYDRDPGAGEPLVAPDAGLFRVIRGGSAALPRALQVLETRGWLPVSFEDETVGLRLARGATGAAPPERAPRKRPAGRTPR